MKSNPDLNRIERRQAKLNSFTGRRVAAQSAQYLIMK